MVVDGCNGGSGRLVVFGSTQWLAVMGLMRLTRPLGFCVNTACTLLASSTLLPCFLPSSTFPSSSQFGATCSFRDSASAFPSPLAKVSSYIHIYTYIYIYIYIYIYMHAHRAWPGLYTCIHCTHTHTYIHVYIHIYIYIYIYTHTNIMCICVCVYDHAHSSRWPHQLSFLP